MDYLSLGNWNAFVDLIREMDNFPNYAPMETNAYGCELGMKTYKITHYLYPEADLTCGDIRNYKPGIKLDYVIGNLPFNLHW